MDRPARGIRPHQTRIAFVVSDDERQLALDQRVDRLLDGCDKELHRTDVQLVGGPATLVEYRSRGDRVSAALANVAGTPVVAVCFGSTAPFELIVPTLRPFVAPGSDVPDAG